MPFVTEELYSMLPIKEEESLMICKYPKYEKNLIFKKEKEIVENKIEFIKAFRNVKNENNINKDASVMMMK